MLSSSSKPKRRVSSGCRGKRARFTRRTPCITRFVVAALEFQEQRAEADGVLAISVERESGRNVQVRIMIK